MKQSFEVNILTFDVNYYNELSPPTRPLRVVRKSSSVCVNVKTHMISADRSDVKYMHKL